MTGDPPGVALKLLNHVKATPCLAFLKSNKDRL